MRQIFTITTALLLTLAAQAQQKQDKKKSVIGADRANDHFLLQFGLSKWTSNPDTVATKGLGRDLNAYFMFDFPFKTNRQLSVGIGAGVSTHSTFFSNRSVNIAGNNNVLTFTNLDSANHFKKYKLVAAYLEAPVELRYVLHPENSDRSFKFAVGAKVGTLLSVHTRGKDLVDKNGNMVNSYVEKVRQKKYFNSNRLSLTARVGWGNFTVYGQYMVTPLLKDGAGPEIRPYTIGLTLSGL